MTLFKKAESTQAYLKAGFMGFAGSGKTFTATETAIGLVKMLKDGGLPEGDRPVFFLDTETGSDYVSSRFKDAGIELYQAKTRAFIELIPALREAETNGAALIIDSITHFWREFTESYAKKKNRHRGLEFQDWAYLKSEWGKFTDAYINSSLHIIMCGRAGYEYDFFTNDNGKRELEKTGIKMKAETETGYEPSLLVLMERSMDMETKKVYREAHVLKERFNVIDGSTFKNPTFEDFLPHIQRLNLGGTQLGVGTRTSESMIPMDGKSQWQKNREQIEIVLDEIQTFISRKLNTRKDEDRKIMLEMFVKFFGTESWKKIELLDLERLRLGYDSIRLEQGESPVYAQPIMEDVPELPLKTDTTEAA